MHLRPSDIIASTLPSLATITLEQANSAIALIGGILGISYLLWKWVREARRSRARD